jgi:hypothetical protein
MKKNKMKFQGVEHTLPGGVYKLANKRDSGILWNKFKDIMKDYPIAYI